MIRESYIERRIVAELKKRNAEAYKFVSPARRGVPDRIIFWGLNNAVSHYKKLRKLRNDKDAEKELRMLISMVIEFVEVKSEKGRLMPVQVREMRKLESLGFKVSVLKDLSDIEVWCNKNGG